MMDTTDTAPHPGNGLIRLAKIVGLILLCSALGGVAYKAGFLLGEAATTPVSFFEWLDQPTGSSALVPTVC